MAGENTVRQFSPSAALGHALALGLHGPGAGMLCTCFAYDVFLASIVVSEPISLGVVLQTGPPRPCVRMRFE